MLEGGVQITEDQNPTFVRSIEKYGMRRKIEVHNNRVKRDASQVDSRWDLLRDDDGNYVIPVELLDSLSKLIYKIIVFIPNDCSLICVHLYKSRNQSTIFSKYFLA